MTVENVVENSNQKWNNNERRCECKNPKEHNAWEKDYIWNHATSCCEHVEYLASTIEDLVITCDKLYTMQIVYQQMHQQCYEGFVNKFS